MALAAAITSCTSDLDESIVSGGPTNGGSTEQSAFTFLTPDQSRVVAPVNTAYTYGTATRSGETVKVPTVEDIIEFDYKNISQTLPNNVSNGAQNKPSGNYKITESGYYSLASGSLSGTTNVVIFAGAEVTLSNSQDSQALNIYVLPGATLNLEETANPNLNIYCWGTFKSVGGQYWDSKQFTIEGNSSLHLYSTETWELDRKMSVQNPNNAFFESYAPVHFKDEVFIRGGDFHFHNQVTFENF